MTQVTPATAVLGPGKTGLAIGLRVLNLDGTTYAAFSATGVAETSVLGTYRKAGGVVVPDAGGYIVWGVSGTDYAEATVEAVASVADWTTGEREQIRYRLQLDGTQTAPVDTDLPAVNVTLWKGAAPSDLINGNVTSHMIDLGVGGGAADAVPGLFTFGQSYYYDDGAKLSAEGRQNVADGLKLTPTAGAADAGSAMDYLADILAAGGGASIDPQDVADAMLLAPSGVAAAGSVMDYLAIIEDDTGTTLPASIAAISQIVDNNTTDATTAGSITRRRGDSWAIQLTIGSITGYTSLWFTARGDRDAADTESVVQVKKNASGLLDGLLYVNGAVAATAGLGSITVSNAATGAIIITLDEAVTDDLAPAEIYYDVQVLNGGNVTTPDLGTLTITADVTRAIL